MKMKTTILPILALCLLTACDDVFQVHPYDMRFDGETGINAHHIAEIEPRCLDKDTLRVAFISDTHGWYSETKDEVADINRQQT